MLYIVKAGAVNSKSFITHAAEDVMKIVGVRQEKSDATNAHRTTVSVSALFDKLARRGVHAKYQTNGAIDPMLP